METIKVTKAARIVRDGDMFYVVAASGAEQAFGTLAAAEAAFDRAYGPPAAECGAGYRQAPPTRRCIRCGALAMMSASLGPACEDCYDELS